MINDTNRRTKRLGKVEQAQDAFVELLRESLRQGFYGAATLSLNIQDGAIQHVRVTMEKMVK